MTSSGDGERLCPSRALVMQVTPSGALIATNSISRAHLHLTPDSMLVLLSYAAGATRAEALARLVERFGVDPTAFASTTDELVRAGFLTPEQGPAQPAEGHFADVLTHLAMLADEPRVAAYRAAIERHAPGRFVLELGTGSGVLSIFAARAGARRVLAVEETAIAGLAAELFAANAPAVELAVRSSRDLTLPDDQRADLIVHELLGADPLAEGLLPTIADARRRLLAPGGRLVPSRLQLYATGIALTDAPVDRTAAQTQTSAIAARHALDLAPLSRAVSALPARAYQHTLRGASYELLTEPTLLHDLDLTTVDEEACAAPLTRTLTVTRAGTLSAVLLHFRAHLDSDLVLSNGPELPETHWGRRITALSNSRPVHPGDRLPLQVTREATLHHERLRLDLGSLS